MFEKQSIVTFRVAVSIGTVLLLLSTPLMTQAQNKQTQDQAPLQPEPKFAELDRDKANEWAEMVLKNIDIEFPNKMSLVYVDKSQIKSPKENFPAFYGCFDWHSSVHGHWVLARLLRTMPDLPAAPRMRNTLKNHLSKENLLQEAEFFERDEHKSFERMYGWSWYLRLVMEFEKWDDPDAQQIRENLRPLERILQDRIQTYLPLLSYPIRIGQHTDTGFALGQILDYARLIDHPKLVQLVTQRASTFYLDDQHYPVAYEPSGHDFFSSCWNEADLMRRLLPTDHFADWLNAFVPDAKRQLTDGTIQPVTVTDITDGKLVHLAGLNLNRAWCLHSVAEALPADHELKVPLLDSAKQHLDCGVEYVQSGHYEGDHWLATFALYAITEAGTR